MFEDNVSIHIPTKPNLAKGNDSRWEVFNIRFSFKLGMVLNDVVEQVMTQNTWNTWVSTSASQNIVFDKFLSCIFFQ